MIEKFAIVSGGVLSEFLDLNRTSELMILVSLMISKFARRLAATLANFEIGTLVRVEDIPFTAHCLEVHGIGGVGLDFPAETVDLHVDGAVAAG